MTKPQTPLHDLLVADAGWRAGKVLDVRPAAAFAAGHLRGAVSWPLAPSSPADALENELPSIFLPPRHLPLLVVAATEAQAAAVAGALAARGREHVSALAPAPGALAALPPPLVDRGAAGGHLWEPPAWLRRHVDLLPPPALGPVLDLGCGSGRAAVWLAERGYRVTGVDRQPEACELGRLLADSRGVACAFRVDDLRRADAVPDGPWGAVLAFRYLRRELLPRLASLLAPAGVVMLRTFRDAPGYRGQPEVRHRLRAGELPGWFPAGQYEILAHEEGHDADGRPAAGIVARRRGWR